MEQDVKDATTRRRILESARRIAMERGYKGTTIARIQQDAGVHPGSFYWHFKDKDSLFAAMVRGAQEHTELMVQSLDAEAPNPVKAVLDSIVGRPERFGLWRFNVQLMMDSQMRQSRTAAEILRLRELTQHTLTTAWVEHVPTRVTDANPGLPRQLADYSLATVEGCILSRVAGTPRDEDFITAMASAVMDRMVVLACEAVGEPVPAFVQRRERGLPHLVERMGVALPPAEHVVDGLPERT
ncbi:TetR/AcrR family transcriptional regulator [Luteococcus sp. OSA5]|uniref:TetR/AcrR family transcriptional regulator n=1 Tax=Luteococcus sp. OSA5 TaxID=3401630 RepID=UPI003B43D523